MGEFKGVSNRLSNKPQPKTRSAPSKYHPTRLIINPEKNNIAKGDSTALHF